MKSPERAEVPSTLIHFALPVLNTHRLAKEVEVTIEAVNSGHPELFEAALKEFDRQKIDLRKAGLVEPQVEAALGLETSFAPPSPERRQAEFVESVLKCEQLSSIDKEIKEQIMRCAFDLESRSLYVLPPTFRPMTNIGEIPPDAARDLRPRDCRRKALKPGDDKKAGEAPTWTLDLQFRQFAQLLLTIKTAGAYLLKITYRAVVADDREVEICTFYLPSSKLAQSAKIDLSRIGAND